jgi:phage shock protein A
MLNPVRRIPSTELDSRLSNSSTSQSRIQEAHSALQVKIKSLEAQLQRVEAEKESLKVDASFADRNAAFRGHVAGGEREKDTVSGLERLVADLRQENIKLIEENKRVSQWV